MIKLADYKQSKLESIADLLAVIEREEAGPIEGLAIVQEAGGPVCRQAENGHDCTVEETCHINHGINGGGALPYVCGFRIAGTAWGCPRRRRMQGYEKP